MSDEDPASEIVYDRLGVPLPSDRTYHCDEFQELDQSLVRAINCAGRAGKQYLSRLLLSELMSLYYGSGRRCGCSSESENNPSKEYDTISPEPPILDNNWSAVKQYDVEDVKIYMDDGGDIWVSTQNGDYLFGDHHNARDLRQEHEVLQEWDLGEFK